MNSDEFISTKKELYQKKLVEDDDNFFLQTGMVLKADMMQSEPLRHLNDYDSNILKDGAYKDIKDETFKLEYKILKIEEELKEVNKQIITAKEIHDNYMVESLSNRRTLLEKDLKILMEMYNEASISAKISGNLTSKIKDKFVSAGKFINNIGTGLISKFSGKFSSILEVKNSLNKLEDINKSVDALMNCQYPYGEAEYRYAQLSKYIARANSIQSEISKFVK